LSSSRGRASGRIAVGYRYDGGKNEQVRRMEQVTIVRRIPQSWWDDDGTAGRDRRDAGPG